MSARGTVIKRGQAYSVVLDLGRNADNKRIRQWHSGFTSEKAAEKARTALLKSLDDGAYVAPSSESVAAYLDRWLAAVRVTVRSSTAALYRTLVVAYVKPRLGQLRLEDLSAPALNAFYADLLTSGRRRGGIAAPLSATSVHNVHRVVHRALADAVRWGVLPRNVADFADPPKTSTPEARAWGAEQVRAFLVAVDSDRLSALWRLAAMTGMRRGELVGLRWADVDLETERVNVAQVATMVGASVRYGEPKTRTSRRSIALDAGTVTALKTHRKRQLEERLAWGTAWADTGLVFTHEDGRALMPPHVTRMFGRLVTAAGLPELTLHGLRHSHITALLRAGQPIRVVSARAGHSSPAITLGVYAHVLPGDDEAAALAAANAVAEAKESRPRF